MSFFGPEFTEMKQLKTFFILFYFLFLEIKSSSYPKKEAKGGWLQEYGSI